MAKQCSIQASYFGGLRAWDFDLDVSKFEFLTVPVPAVATGVIGFTDSIVRLVMIEGTIVENSILY